MPFPAVGLTKLSPNKITFQVTNTEVLEPRIGERASVPILFARVSIVFHCPGIGDVEKEFDLHAVPHANGEAMKMQIGRVMIPGQGAMFSTITAVLWRVPEISEAFMRAVELHQERFSGRDSR